MVFSRFMSPRLSHAVGSRDASPGRIGRLDWPVQSETNIQFKNKIPASPDRHLAYRLTWVQGVDQFRH